MSWPSIGLCDWLIDFPFPFIRTDLIEGTAQPTYSIWLMYAHQGLSSNECGVRTLIVMPYYTRRECGTWFQQIVALAALLKQLK